MDSWASLEHQMKYKHDIKNPELIVKELKRCADELKQLVMFLCKLLEI